LQEKETNEAYTYQGPRARRMTAEQFVDAVWQLTGAAPTKFDAPVVRGKPIAADPAAANNAAPTGKWVWSETANASGGPPAGEKIAFRTTFPLDKLPSKAFGVITCDNEYRLWINQRLVAEDPNWESLEEFQAKEFLQPGENEVVIVGTNGGSGPNPAALYFEMKLVDNDKTTSIATSTDWKYTTTLPDSNGKLPGTVDDWKSVVVANGPWGARLQNEIATGLTGNSHNGSMVRASLVKADFLMRSLGRPNRDQIVSMRPTELTTLEAMDLSNGQTLAEWLQRGAVRWHQQLQNEGNSTSSQDLVDQLFLFALSRQPRPEELTTINAMIGPSLEVSDLEDLLWAVIMLPDFQYIR
jgi:hypothetical protein